MRIFVNIIGILGLFASISLALYIGPIWWVLTLLPLLFVSIFTISVGADSNYWSYRKKEDTLLDELDVEKDAYHSAKKSFEQTGLLLGNILVDKKENY